MASTKGEQPEARTTNLEIQIVFINVLEPRVYGLTENVYVKILLNPGNYYHSLQVGFWSFLSGIVFFLITKNAL